MRTSFHHQPEAQHPNFQLSTSWQADYPIFSNRPIEVRRFQTFRRHGVNVARGLALLFGFGTKALPSWDSRIRRNNLYRGLAVT